jgi:hypothetical protein
MDPIQLATQRADPAVGPNAGDGTVYSGGTMRPAARLPGVDLNDLAATPGTPAYAKKMAVLREQARAAGDPDEPTPMLILPEQPVLQPHPVEPVLAPAPGPATKRVAIYYGKNDTYNVAVETAPDWDTIFMFKGQDGDGVGILMQLAYHLGVKASDKTGDFS